MTRILLVDDHPVLRAGLRAVLSLSAEVFEASSTDEAIAVLGSQVLDLVVTDLIMEGPNGIHLTKAVKASWPDLPVLVLSNSDESLFAERALLAGASGYVMKGSPVSVLCAAVDAVLAGGIWLSDEVRQRLAPDERPLVLESLSDDEFAVVVGIGQGNPSAFGLGQRLGLSVGRVNRLTASAMQTLGVAARVELIVRASGAAPGASIA